MDKLANLKGTLLVEQVQEQIFQYIMNKPIPVGEKIPNEFDLGQLFGVGRSTIREAVKSLAVKGILEVRRGSGTYVVSVTPIENDPLGVRHMKDKTAVALDLVEARLMIEPQMAELAAIRAVKEDIQKLQYLCGRVEKSIIKGDNYIKDDIDFHCCIAECSKNKIVEQLIPIIDTAVMMFVNITHKQLTDETIATHRSITHAIASGDHIGARNAMTMHLTINREVILKLK